MSNRMKLKDENKKKKEKRVQQQKSLSNNPQLNSSMSEAFSKLNITDAQTQQSMFQMIKYISVFGIGLLIDLVAYLILYRFVGLSPMISNIISILLFFLYAYYGSVKNYLFQKSKILFLFVGSFFLFSECSILLFHSVMKWNPFLIKLLSTILYLVIYYFVFYFKNKKRRK